MTKGYGVTVEEIDWSCPADLEPYAKAHKLELMMDDAKMHSMGAYNKIAYEVVMAHFGSGLSGKKSDARYVDKPFMQQVKMDAPISEEEKQRAVDLFFATEKARRINWKRSKKSETN